MRKERDVKMNNCVSINLKKNEIVIKIAEDAEQKKIVSETLLHSLR